MSGSSPPVDVLAPEGWAHNGAGKIAGGEPQCRSRMGGLAPFKHSRELQAQDVLRTKVVEGREAWVGFAAESYDVEKDGETYKSTAFVELRDGMTRINTDINEDGQHHFHNCHLRPHIPDAQRRTFHRAIK